jgi:hypothetical protein
LGKVLRDVAHTQPISEELDGEGSGSVEETHSFVMDLMIDGENRRVYSSAIACKARLPVLSWYGPIGEQELIYAEPHLHGDLQYYSSRIQHLGMTVKPTRTCFLRGSEEAPKLVVEHLKYPDALIIRSRPINQLKQKTTSLILSL